SSGALSVVVAVPGSLSVFGELQAAIDAIRDHRAMCFVMFLAMPTPCARAPRKTAQHYATWEAASTGSAIAASVQRIVQGALHFFVEDQRHGLRSHGVPKQGLDRERD